VSAGALINMIMLTCDGHVFHLWSGLGLPFFLMLLAVVSLKWRRPTVTFVTCSEGRVILREHKSI